jgi:hypothetical protein
MFHYIGLMVNDQYVRSVKPGSQPQDGPETTLPGY